MSIPGFRDVEKDVANSLREQGGLGLLVVDLLPLERIERSFGPAIYQTLRSQIDPLISELKSHVRDNDVLCQDEREGDRFLVFLAGKRRSEGEFVVSDIRKLAARIADHLTPRVARLTLPYLRERPAVDVGYGFVVYSPLQSAERQILRLTDSALASAGLHRSLRERDEQELLVEIIHNRSVWTVFQHIMDMQTREPMAYEALSRGPRGTELQSPYALFGRAARYGLTDELERACRRKTFEDWVGFGVPTRLFVNTVPATIRDSSFQGRGVLDYLGTRISPSQVTLEITERQVIENVNLYREAMHSFIELGFTFAIDDLGAGYSGLETVATLGATYLKIDMGLVRDVHQKRTSQQVVKAILEMGQGVGATVIAEGIETEEEAAALMAMGLRYGQGYLYGRPVDPSAPKTKPVN